MKKYWHAFYVSDYKGGELHSIVNVTNVNKILDFIVSDWQIGDAFDEVENLEELTDDDLYDIYCSNISNNAYALDSQSAPDIYSTSEDGKLVKDFPSGKEIIQYMHEQLKAYKKWKSGQ